MCMRSPKGVSRTGSATKRPAAAARLAKELPRSGPAWTFLTNHAHVLLCVTREPDARIRDMADAVGITERAVQRILADLAEAGYVATERLGRRNVYRVNAKLPFRHPLEQHRDVSKLLDVVA